MDINKHNLSKISKEETILTSQSGEKEISLENMGQFGWFFGTADTIFSNSNGKWIPFDGRQIDKIDYVDFLAFITLAGLTQMGFDITTDPAKIIVPNLTGNYFVGSSIEDGNIGQIFNQSLPPHQHNVNDHNHTSNSHNHSIPQSDIEVSNSDSGGFRFPSGLFDVSLDSEHVMAGSSSSNTAYKKAVLSGNVNSTTVSINNATGLITAMDGSLNEGEVKPKHIRLMPCIRAK